MHTSSYPADAIAFARHRVDMPDAEINLSGYPQSRPLGPTPRTIRHHVGRRELGSFSSVLRTPPAARDLTQTVARLRARQVTPSPKIAPRLFAMRDAAEQRARRAANAAMLATAAAFVVWVGIPVALATIAGKL